MMKVRSDISVLFYTIMNKQKGAKSIGDRKSISNDPRWESKIRK
ncbi:hypothetical protein LM500065_110213 [Listeria monocytogenes]|nr:hypothetical protein LM500065_110213 [Listeria monocytogenes]